MTEHELEVYTQKIIRQTRLACASMCRAREASLVSGGMYSAANEASKCALAIETHPAFEHHYRKFANEQTN